MVRWKSTIRAGAGLAMLLLITTACNPQWTQNQATFVAMDLMDGSTCVVDHTPTSTTFFVLLGAGLLTGLSHCVGMCGPLVGAFAVRRRAVSNDISSSLVLFQTGRLTTYILLGVVLGATGQIFAAVIHNWQGVVSISLGLLMALVGLSLLGLFPLQKWITSVSFTRTVSGWVKQLMSSNHPAAPFGLGLANGLLPCGPVYAMALLAATTGNPLRGATIMLIFGLGTLPAMLAMGFSTSLLSIRLRSHLYRMAAILVVLVGVQLALRGLAFSGQLPHATVGSVMLW